MREPRWEADRCAWDWPIVVGEPEWKSQMSFVVDEVCCKGVEKAYRSLEEQGPQHRHGRSHLLLLRVRWCSRLGQDQFRVRESQG